MTEEAIDPGARLLASGWRQGSIIAETDLAALGHAGRGCGIVLSQDCDVVHAVEQEPHVEVLLGTRAERPRADRLHGRNPRELDLELLAARAAVHASFLARDRVLIEKHRLASFRPSAELLLPPPSLRTLIKWIVKRYARAAFPDAFNERLGKVDDRLERLVKSDASAPVTGIYLILTPADRELPAGETYRLTVWLTVESKTVGDAAAYERAQTFETRLRAILETCAGVQLRELELKSEADVTLEDLRILKRLDKDYRSLAAKPGGAGPPQGV